ncbi:MAG: aromatic ring-hydroxylating dioxygenase subunit alpha [Sphingomonadales bacterium]|nr:aromatic ring-hydroxylating dioxygenase subunit alpha [Sphingomonadales bacterium]
MPFLRNAWYAAALSSELAEGPVARTILNEPLLILAGEDGNPVAFADMCPHRFAPLSLGRVGDGTITCPYHGLVFDHGGICIHNPHGKGARPASLALRRYPMRQQGCIIWVWMGDPARAEAAPPPDYPFLASDDHVVLSGRLQVQANYELVTDNLLDLSHAEFLHPFIMPEGTASAIKYRAVQDGDRVSVYHSMPNQPNTPMFALVLGDGVQRVNGVANSHWQAPANLMLETGVDVLDEGDGRSVMLPQVHLLTPESERATHYFWAVARHRSYAVPQLDAMLQAGLANAFEYEDEPMIKAVQERMGERELFAMQPALLPMDEGSVRARRTLARLIAEDQAVG